jgi:hypothetical protein
MQTDVATQRNNVPAELQEKVLLGGDLARLTPAERLSYYNAVCDSISVNPLTRPFEYLALNGKLVLYARKDCTDQLRDLRGISVQIVAREVVDGCYVVTAKGQDPMERTDESIGAVPLPSSPADKANAMMKAETKAKRRVTLSICGLGMLDETEVDTISGAHPVPYKEVETAAADGAGHSRETTSPPEDGRSQQASDALPPITDDPSSPYRAKIVTAHDEKECAAAYAATPEQLKQDVHGDYFDTLKRLAKGKARSK